MSGVTPVADDPLITALRRTTELQARLLYKTGPRVDPETVAKVLQLLIEGQTDLVPRPVEIIDDDRLLDEWIEEQPHILGGALTNLLLRSSYIQSFRDLLDYTADELSQINGLGQSHLAKIQQLLAQYGHELPTEPIVKSVETDWRYVGFLPTACHAPLDMCWVRAESTNEVKLLGIPELPTLGHLRELTRPEAEKLFDGPNSNWIPGSASGAQKAKYLYRLLSEHNIVWSRYDQS